jgi:hypothetical protein
VKRFAPPRQFARGLLVLAMAAGAASCTKAQAKTEPERPALLVPEGPPRIVHAPDPELEPERPPEIVPEAVAPPPRSPRAGTRPPPAPKPEREDPAKPPEVKPADPAPPRPPSQADRALEQKIRDRVNEARKTLTRVNPAQLSDNERGQLENARRFLEQAIDALSTGNLTLGNFLAEKGETLARGLAR